MADDLMFRPAGSWPRWCASGEVSARELVEASYEAIERLNGELNAFVTLCEERALAEADADRSRATTARWPACRSRSRTWSR